MGRVIATGANAPKFMLYDGHGLVRHLADNSGTITESYNYDAYGNAHGLTPGNAATSLLYAGEQYESIPNTYYLRARYYNPANGRLNRMDPFSGNSQDPQSLHKYLYVHNNPVNGIDPTGQFGDFTMVSMLNTMYIMARITTLTLNVYGAVRSSANALAAGINAVNAFRQGNRREGVDEPKKPSLAVLSW